MPSTHLHALSDPGLWQRSTPGQGSWLATSFALMRALAPVAQGLASRPAQDASDLPHGGPTFTPLRTLAALTADTAAQVVSERLGQLRERAMALPLTLGAGETAASWQAVIDLLAQQQAGLLALADLAPSAAAPVATNVANAPAAVPADPVPAPALVEVVPGKSLTISFEARRCIHSRHCVLDAPTVFKANTPGAWINPDSVAAEILVGVALSCPSGAIRFERHDGGPAEAPPAVNQLRIRENGPYAFHAPLKVAGQPDGYRATLCRCGKSQNKPWCDGSHVAAGFAASGEPPTGAVDLLAMRDGPLNVTPTANCGWKATLRSAQARAAPWRVSPVPICAVAATAAASPSATARMWARHSKRRGN